MKKIRMTIMLLTVAYLSASMLNSCKKDEGTIASTDKDLYEKALGTDRFIWYKNSSDLLERSSASGHPQPFLRTRYNEIAATQLDSTFQIKAGTTFPEGSIIVKELYNSASSLGRYAILYKQSDHTDADGNGWVWGYINSDGSVADPASNKGTTCIGCHSQTDNIDYMLMNKYFP